MLEAIHGTKLPSRSEALCAVLTQPNPHVYGGWGFPHLCGNELLKLLFLYPGHPFSFKIHKHQAINEDDVKAEIRRPVTLSNLVFQFWLVSGLRLPLIFSFCQMKRSLFLKKKIIWERRKDSYVCTVELSPTRFRWLHRKASVILAIRIRCYIGMTLGSGKWMCCRCDRH